MKKILILLVMILGTSLQAQTAFDFNCADDSVFGNLSSFMPSSWSSTGTPPAREGKSYMHTAYMGSNTNIGASHTIKSPSSYSVDFGDSVIHTKSSPIVFSNIASSNSVFDEVRITGGNYDGYVMVVNSNTREVFAKWSNGGKIDLIIVIHKEFSHDQSFNPGIELDFQDVGLDFAYNSGSY